MGIPLAVQVQGLGGVGEDSLQTVALPFTDGSRFLVTIIGGTIAGGFSEQYLSPAESSTASLAADIQALITARQALSTGDTYFTEIRVSQYGTVRQSQVLLPPQTRLWNSVATVQFSPTGTYSQVGYTGGQNQLRACAIWQITFGTNRTNRRYLAGPPIGISTDEPSRFNFNNNGRWFNNFVGFGNTLVGKWSIIGSNVGAAGTLYTVGGVVTGAAPTNYLGVVIPAAAGLPALTMGQRIKITGMRPAKGSRGPTINGGWSVFSTDTTTVPGYTTVFLQNSTGISPAVMRTTAKSALRIPVPVPYTILAVDLLKNGIRKRGKVSTQYRGRRLTRPTLDP